MQSKQGIPVSPGVAIVKAVIVDARDLPLPRRRVQAEAVPRQLERLESALVQSREEVNALRLRTAEVLGDELAKIFSFHLGMLSDPSLVAKFRDEIQEGPYSAEYAVQHTMRELGKTFAQQGDRYLRERVSDVRDLERRVLKHLLGNTRTDLSKLTEPSVVIAHDLTPSQTASLDRTKVHAIATDLGGRTSHTAILAHALGIPAIVGLENITREAVRGQTVIVDGFRGLVILDPDEETLDDYREQIERVHQIETSLAKIRDLPAVTTDGTPITLKANIEFPTEIEEVLRNGGEGIGLYRTEFLYLGAHEEPTEEEQYETYVEVIRKMEGRPVTIRTLDLGADKVVLGLNDVEVEAERNPFLGCRSIRLCLQNLPLFKRQLRAVMRAAVEGDVRIMFPLISNLMELRQAKTVLNEVMDDLDDEGIPRGQNVPVGMMIEVPSAALQAKKFARECDFFSIGTNDLVQYTVAVDRGNERIASLYSAGHPSVIGLIKETIRAAGRADIPVGLCGEMASEPEFTMLLIGLGLRELSITPPAIPEIKQAIRGVSLDDCKRVARRVASFDTNREVINYVREEMHKLNPRAIIGGRSA